MWSSRRRARSGERDLQPHAPAVEVRQLFRWRSLGEGVFEVEKALEASEQEELVKEQGKLQQTISTFGINLKTGLDTILGRSPDMDADEIAAEVEDRLKTEAAQNLSKEADEITTLAVDGLEVSIDMEEGQGVSTGALLEDIDDYEETAEPKLRDDIDQAEAEIEKGLDKRGKEIEVEVLEEKLTEKLGHEVHLELEENGDIDGLEEALDEVEVQAAKGTGVPATGGDDEN